MAEHPDNWVILKIAFPNTRPLYKVLAGWSGGYLDSDSWKLNSGIVAAEKVGSSWVFYGRSGSEYWCNAGQYKIRMNTAGIHNKLLKEYPEVVDTMPEDTDWSKIEW